MKFSCKIMPVQTLRHVSLALIHTQTAVCKGLPKEKGKACFFTDPCYFGRRCLPSVLGTGRGPALCAAGPGGERTVVLILPFSVVMLSRWCRCAKGLAAPQDSRYRVMRTEALILAPSRVWRGLKR